MGKSSNRKKIKQIEESKYSETMTQETVEALWENEYEEKTEEYTKADAKIHYHRIKVTEDMYELIEITRVPDSDVRLKATKEMCPCKVREDIPEFWDRLFELSQDEDPKVRYQVMHNLCDGSPVKYELQVVECLERLAKDKDNHVRSKA